MTTASATARYVIAADDKSQSAIRSVVKGFRDMDRDIRGVLKTLNGVVGIFLGVQLIQGFRKVVDATASASAWSSGFAAALRDVKTAVGDLLVAKDGLPEATKNLRELQEMLKDPAIRSAADSLTSSMVVGFTKVAKIVAETIAGVKQLVHTPTMAEATTRQQVSDALEAQIAEREKRLGQVANRSTYDLSGYSAGLAAAETEKLKAEIADLKQRQFNVLTGGPGPLAPKGHGPIPVTSDEVQRSALGDRLIREEDDRHEAFMRNINQEIAAYKVSIVNHEQNTKAILSETDRYLDQQVAIRDQLEEINLNAIEAKKTFIKTVDDEVKAMAEIWKEAARGMFNAWEQFFFDPFKGGLKGLALGIIEVIRHAIAAQAALALMKQLSDYGSKTGGFIGTIASILGGSFGGAKAGGGPVSSGRSYLVGENGPEFFRPNTSGSIIPNGALAGGMVFAPTYNIDARGATQDLIQALPQVLQANNEALKADIVDTLDRRRRRG